MTFIIMFIVMPGFAVSMFDAFNLDHNPSSSGFGGMSLLFVSVDKYTAVKCPTVSTRNRYL
ncbi:hypothetical protein AAG747_18930 [Rapidithrix thailandica]|uniref:Uncharacterized protein n=1 Tax=Rapidithrix thailandica TaxID=413964 RepID=A0AAW9S1N0_9BACT